MVPNTEEALGDPRLSLERVQGFCRQRGLGGFKLPRMVLCVVGGLPRNATGKVDKVECRQLLGNTM